jgi:hypothetical protein
MEKLEGRAPEVEITRYFGGYREGRASGWCGGAAEEERRAIGDEYELGVVSSIEVIYKGLVKKAVLLWLEKLTCLETLSSRLASGAKGKQ